MLRKLALTSCLVALILTLGVGCVREGQEVHSLTVEVVLGSNGEPVSGVQVRLQAPDGSLTAVQQTDADGRISWPAAEIGTLVAVDDASEVYFAQEKAFSDPENPMRFELSKGLHAELRVVAGDGEESRALADAEVAVWPMEGTVIRSKTAADGKVRVGPISQGDVKVSIHAPGFERSVLDFTVVPDRKTLGDVELKPGGAKVHGRIGDFGGQTPNDVLLRFQGVAVSETVDANGEFAIEGLPQGPGVLSVRRGQRELVSLRVQVRGEDVDLGLVEPAVITARR